MVMSNNVGWLLIRLKPITALFQQSTNIASSTAEHKAFDKLCQQDFACKAKALKALNVFAKKLKTTSINDTEVETLPRYKGKGRPAARTGFLCLLH